MSDKIVKIGFNIIKENLENNNLEDNFLIFDNFSEENEVLELVFPTDYPIRLNRITLIVFCLEGHIKCDFGLKNITISKNQLCIMLQDQIIQTTEISSDFKAGFIVLRRNFFNSQNHFIETINLHNNLIKQPYFDLSEKEMHENILIFNQIKEKIADRNHIYRLQIVQSYFQITFYNIYHLIVARQNISEKTYQNNHAMIYDRYIKMVAENYRKEHSVKFYADRICLTPKYLSAVIYEVSSKHASEWIHEYIILEAKSLLKSTDRNIKNISEILHFCTPSHFGRFFKRYTGYTPNEYKKMQYSK